MHLLIPLALLVVSSDPPPPPPPSSGSITVTADYLGGGLVEIYGTVSPDGAPMPPTVRIADSLGQVIDDDVPVSLTGEYTITVEFPPGWQGFAEASALIAGDEVFDETPVSLQ